MSVEQVLDIAPYHNFKHPPMPHTHSKLVFFFLVLFSSLLFLELLEKHPFLEESLINKP